MVAYQGVSDQKLRRNQERQMLFAATASGFLGSWTNLQGTKSNNMYGSIKKHLQTELAAIREAGII